MNLRAFSYFSSLIFIIELYKFKSKIVSGGLSIKLKIGLLLIILSYEINSISSLLISILLFIFK